MRHVCVYYVFWKSDCFISNSGNGLGCINPPDYSMFSKLQAAKKSNKVYIGRETVRRCEKLSASNEPVLMRRIIADF